MGTSDAIKQAAAEAEPIRLEGMPGAPGPEQGAPDPAEAAGFPLNDFGNGQRLAHYCGADLRHVPRLGWLRWDGRRWQSDEDAVTVRADAQTLGARIEAEIPHLALEDSERDAISAYDAARPEIAELEALDRKAFSADQKKRWLELMRIRDEGLEAKDRLKSARAAHRRFASTSGNSGRITNAMQEAAVLVRTDVGALNTDPYMVNTRSGVLCFRQDAGAAPDPDAPSWRDEAAPWRVSLVPHDRGHLITKMVEADYRPEAVAPIFEAFLERVQPDDDMRDFLQRFAGYTILGRTNEQKLVFNYGVGRNGKSTLMDALAAIFADYGTTLPIESLTGTEQRKGSEATPDLVRLPGARFVRASEPEQGTKMKEALIKALTGGEAILVRRMHQEFLEIVPVFTLWISGNHKPEIRGADDGIWRRVMLVPWEVQIPAEDVDPELPAKILAERDGILAWLVEGALRYLNEGLKVPDKVLAATADYRQQSDPMRLFLQVFCDVTGQHGDRVLAADMRDAFNAWRLEEAESTWTSNTVSRRIRERVGMVRGEDGETFEHVRSNGETFWRGIRLTQRARDLFDKHKGQLELMAIRGKT